MRMSRPLVLLLLPPFLVSIAVQAQQPPASNVVRATMDAQSAVLVPKVLGLLHGATAVTDITLTGAATRTVGSDVETGTITMKALGPWDSRIDFVSGGGTWTEVHNAVPPAAPQGYTVGPDGVQHKIAGHNTHIDAVWFFPSFGALARLSNPQLTVTYVGTETKNGIPVIHLHFISQFPPAPASVVAKRPPHFIPPPIAPLTAEELYLDPQTMLPVMLTFNTHPDKNFLVNIPVEIHFSDYQAVTGAQIPFHIQQFLNGVLLYDITVQSATINSGLSASEFSIQ